jgi:hypothetical protein
MSLFRLVSRHVIRYGRGQESMNDTVSLAIYAVHLDDDSVERWFELICRTYAGVVEAGHLDWRNFVSALTDGAMPAGVSSALVEQFADQMTANDRAPLETVGHMAELAAELPRHYREGAMAAQSAAAVPAEHYDESAWHAFLVAHGARWDGAENSWHQFRAWFLYEAEQRGLAVPANQFIAYAESQQDKAGVFAEWQIPLAAAHATADDRPTTVNADAFPETKHGDAGEWVEYLHTMLAHHGF